MTIGPVQLVVIGFEGPTFQGEILAELDRLKAADVVRVIDALFVYRDDVGDVSILERSDLDPEDAAEVGAVVGGLIGLGAGGEDGMASGMVAGAEAAEAGAHLFSEEQAWDVAEDIPKDSAAAIVLLEHRWAIPLRDAVRRAGGFRVGDSFISPLDLVAVGLISASEAEALEGTTAGR